MTPSQVSLLRNLIDADREYHTKIARGEPTSADDRGIEIGGACDRRTAYYLVENELAEIVSITKTQSRVFLGKYNPYDS